jgi:dTDP-4-amino-4,6-dideoxygalactose transaminase
MLVKFGDLSREFEEIGQEINAAISRVLRRGWFILGPEVEAFEDAFAAYLNITYCVGCASGTEAIALALMACDVGAGDEVITVAHTAVPTVSAISMVGAQPIFVDVDPDTCLMDVTRVEAAISAHTHAIVPVHLYGQCVNMEPLLSIANRYGIPVIEDCAQAHGARHKEQMAGTMGLLGAFSFYPSKNLGCYGDGGMVVTNDETLAKKLRMLRSYGQRQRYYHEIKGINSRLDELQAAILMVKLPYLNHWNERRRRIANMYHNRFQELPVVLPSEMENNYHVYHIYAIQTPKRDALREYLEQQGVQTLIHYPIPVHQQKAYLMSVKEALPSTESVAGQILSLPIYPQMRESEVTMVIETIERFFT